MTIVLAMLACGFVALGLWQVERRAWKHALIEAVETRAHAAPVEAPAVAGDKDAYRRVTATGHFLQDKRTLVLAVTARGSGYWAMVPLDTGRLVLLVNRGFVAQDARGKASREPEGLVTVTGLIRLTEPGGGFLRSNDPQADRWYSRDVAAIAAARGLRDAAPYFIDADATANRPGEPVGGLTVLRFSDNHLSYALTWFAMAALCLLGLWRVRRSGEQP